MNDKRATRVQRYLRQALASNTVAAYASDLQHFRAWGGRIPATPETLARYLADCAQEVKVSTLIRRLSAIRHAHMARGLGSPTGAAIVQRTLRGIRRVHGSAPRQAAPLTLAMLKVLMQPQEDEHPVRDLRDRALILLGFAGGFRRSELVSLRPCDLQIGGEGVLVHLRRSKTDAEGKGRVIAIPKGKGKLCPVRVLMRWIAALRRLDPAGAVAPLFRRVNASGTLGGGLAPAAVRDILRG